MTSLFPGSILTSFDGLVGRAVAYFMQTVFPAHPLNERCSVL